METKGIFGSCLDSKEVFSVLGKAEEKWNWSVFVVLANAKGLVEGRVTMPLWLLAIPAPSKFFLQGNEYSSVCLN